MVRRRRPCLQEKHQDTCALPEAGSGADTRTEETQWAAGADLRSLWSSPSVLVGLKLFKTKNWGQNYFFNNSFEKVEAVRREASFPHIPRPSPLPPCSPRPRPFWRRGVCHPPAETGHMCGRPGLAASPLSSLPGHQHLKPQRWPSRLSPPSAQQPRHRPHARSPRGEAVPPPCF